MLISSSFSDIFSFTGMPFLVVGVSMLLSDYATLNRNADVDVERLSHLRKELLLPVVEVHL